MNAPMRRVDVINCCKDFLLDRTAIEAKPQFVTDSRKGRGCAAVKERIRILASLLAGVSR